MSWTPISVIDRQFQVGRHKNIRVVRRQFPLKPSAAMTIHKCQGMSLQCTSVSVRRTMQAHMVYVAPSRVTSLHGLHLLDLDSSKIKVDQHVVKEMQRLRQDRTVDLVPKTLKSVESEITLVCHNSRSLHNHIEDMRSDTNIIFCDVLIIQETWALPSDSVEYYVIQEDCTRRPHSGTFAYLNMNITLITATEMTTGQVEGLHLLLRSHTITFQVLAVYSRPGGKVASIIEVIQQLVIEQYPLVVLGDFNIGQLKPGGELAFLWEFMFTNFYLHSVLQEETTDYHSSLDHIYVADRHQECGTLETYWSDHKMIWVAMGL
jgi:hypothetical protein